jgi:hypothetical protein
VLAAARQRPTAEAACALQAANGRAAEGHAAGKLDLIQVAEFMKRQKSGLASSDYADCFTSELARPTPLRIFRTGTTAVIIGTVTSAQLY